MDIVDELIVYVRVVKDLGDQADTGQEDGVDGGGVSADVVGGENTTDLGLEAEEEREGLRKQMAPEASFGGIRLERVPPHERLRPENEIWLENRRLEN